MMLSFPNLDCPNTGGPRRYGPTLSPCGKKASSLAGSSISPCHRGLAWPFLLPAADRAHRSGWQGEIDRPRSAPPLHQATFNL